MASDNWRTCWASSKRDIALSLASGNSGAGYGDAVILLCAAISAFAAEMWPGRGIDRGRFIEALVRVPQSAPSLETVSVPLLVQYLRAHSFSAEAGLIAQALLPIEPSRVITGADVDKGDSDLLARCPSIPAGALVDRRIHPQADQGSGGQLCAALDHSCRTAQACVAGCQVP